MNGYTKTVVFFVCIIMATAGLSAVVVQKNPESGIRDPHGVLETLGDVSAVKKVGLRAVLHERLLLVIAWLRNNVTQGL